MPEEYEKGLFVQVSDTLHRALKLRAIEEGRTMSALVRSVLGEYVQNVEKVA